MAGAGDRISSDASSQFSAGGPPVISKHLPAALENFKVISRFESKEPFGDVKPGQIADVAVHKGFAYLNFWDDEANTCKRGGTQVVDITDPAKPKQAAFIAAKKPYYHGEGAQVISVDTPQFKGDLLAVNDETYGCEADTSFGGFDLYDVTDPRNPKVLIQAAGDKDSDNDPATAPNEAANSYHSVFVWQDGPRAYLVASDNVETQDTDVDIFDITDPKAPEQVADLNVGDKFPQVLDGEDANGGSVFHHDVVVKKVDGKQRMLISYWDGGYVQLDVTDPKTPTYVTDTKFTGEDPLGVGRGFNQEGNAHQAEYSYDNQFILAADEDFTPDRATTFKVDGTDFPVQSVGGGTSPNILADKKLNGPTYYGGYGCDASLPIPTRASKNPSLAAGEEAIIVLQRGPSGDAADTAPEACFPGEKAENGIAAGWDGVVLTNRHLGSVDDDEAFCGSGDFPDEPPIVTACTSHAGFHAIFSIDDGNFATPVPPGHHPALGTAGKKIETEAAIDGWGYAHLYDAKTSQPIDHFAIAESEDPRYSFGFGDLSIHEFATDPTEPVAYSAYYAGGIRAFTFSRADGLKQTGKYIDPAGSNFWGIEQFTGADGERYVAGSDRDFGLVVLKYTGPGAAQRPVCADALVGTTAGKAVGVPLTCTDANGNTLTLKIAGQPANGTLGAISGNTVAYTPRAGFAGADAFTFTANDGAADAATATGRVLVVAAPIVTPPRPSNSFTLRFGRFSKGKVKVTVTTAAAGRLVFQLSAKLSGSRSTRLYRKTLARPKGRSSFNVKLSASNLRKLRAAVARRKGKTLRGSTRSEWTPTGGVRRVVSKSLTLRR